MVNGVLPTVTRRLWPAVAFFFVTTRSVRTCAPFLSFVVSQLYDLPVAFTRPSTRNSTRVMSSAETFAFQLTKPLTVWPSSRPDDETSTLFDLPTEAVIVGVAACAGGITPLGAGALPCANVLTYLR